MSPGAAVELLRRRAAALGFTIKDTARGFLTRCPAHDDTDPSLNIDEGAKGAVLQCRSRQCNVGRIVQGFGVTMADLYDDAAGRHLNGDIPLRKARGRPRTNFASWGEALSLLQAQHGAGSISTHIYQDEHAPQQYREVLAVFRIDTADGKTFRQASRREDGRWSWSGIEGRAPLYRLPSLLAKSSEAVVVVEGERKVELLEQMGLVATCSVQGANAARKTDWGQLRGREVVVLPDNDDAGRGYAREVKRLALNAGAVSVRIVELPGLEHGHDVIDWTRAHGKDVEQLRTIIGDPANEVMVDVEAEVAAPANSSSMPLETVPTPMVEPPPRDVAWQSLSFDEVLALPPIDWIVADLLPRGSTALLAGEPRSGKSFLAIDLALALCSSASSWLGSTVLSHGKVAYVALEGSQGLAGRLRAWRTNNPTATVRGFELVDWRGDPPLAAGWEPFAAELRRLHREAGGEFGLDGLDVVVIDTLALAGLPDENDSSTVGAVLRRVNALAAELRCTFLLLHHLRKPSTDTRASSGPPGLHEIRGSSALVGNVDLVFTVDYREGREERAMVVRKSKDSMVPPASWFALEGVPTGKVDVHGRAETSCFVLPAEAPQKGEHDAGDAKAARITQKLDRVRPDVLDRLLQVVAHTPGLTKTAIRARLGTSFDVAAIVIEEAIAEERVRVVREKGRHGLHPVEVDEGKPITASVLERSRTFQNETPGTEAEGRSRSGRSGGTRGETHTHPDTPDQPLEGREA